MPWAEVAADCVADLRAAGVPAVAGLVAELGAASPDFACLWGRHDVRVNRWAPRPLDHPARGRVALDSEILTAADGLRLVVFQGGG